MGGHIGGIVQRGIDRMGDGFEDRPDKSLVNGFQGDLAACGSFLSDIRDNGHNYRRSVQYNFVSGMEASGLEASALAVQFLSAGDAVNRIVLLYPQLSADPFYHQSIAAGKRVGMAEFSGDSGDSCGGGIKHRHSGADKREMADGLDSGDFYRTICGVMVRGLYINASREAVGGGGV